MNVNTEQLEKLAAARREYLKIRGERNVGDIKGHSAAVNIAFHNYLDAADDVADALLEGGSHE